MNFQLSSSTAELDLDYLILFVYYRYIFNFSIFPSFLEDYLINPIQIIIRQYYQRCFVTTIDLITLIRNNLRKCYRLKFCIYTRGVKYKIFINHWSAAIIPENVTNSFHLSNERIEIQGFYHTTVLPMFYSKFTSRPREF